MGNAGIISSSVLVKVTSKALWAALLRGLYLHIEVFIGLFRFSISSSVNFNRHIVPGIFLFLLTIKIYWHFVHNVLYDAFHS